MKLVKYVLFALAGLAVLAGALVAFVAASFDPNKHKPEIIKLVKEKTGRTLALDGDISLTFFPRIGVAVGKLSLSEPGGVKVFALEVGRVHLSGLKLDLERFKDGHSNFDDLTGGDTKARDKPATKGDKPFKIDVEGVSLQNANIGWRDDAAGTQIRLSGMQLSTTRIASGVPGKLEFSAEVQGVKPKLNVQVKLAAAYRVDFVTRAMALSGLDLKISGDAPGASGENSLEPCGL